ncbi:MAG: EF-hand domain-containing protein [Polaromonas sp.]|uniref:EF-hand domain-containing protein n=1 Tax=Polaromonas sp. TaxID=1869339 RepID=UPI0032669FB4
MTVYATSKKYSIPRLELRNMGYLVLAAALGAGAASAVRAQTAPPAPASPNSPPSHMAPSGAGGATEPVPQNRVTGKDIEAAFNRADANKDGKLDRQEAEHFPAVAQRFEQIDTNRDTFISLAELVKAASGS